MASILTSGFVPVEYDLNDPRISHISMETPNNASSTSMTSSSTSRNINNESDNSIEHSIFNNERISDALLQSKMMSRLSNRSTRSSYQPGVNLVIPEETARPSPSPVGSSTRSDSSMGGSKQLVDPMGGSQQWTSLVGSSTRSDGSQQWTSPVGSSTRSDGSQQLVNPLSEETGRQLLESIRLSMNKDNTPQSIQTNISADINTPNENESMEEVIESIDPRLSNRDPFSSSTSIRGSVNVVNKSTRTLSQVKLPPIGSSKSSQKDIVGEPEVETVEITDKIISEKLVKLTIYTKGAVISNGDRGAWSVVIYDGSDKKEIDAFMGDQEYVTEIRMELQAIYESLLYVNEYFTSWSVLVYTDNDSIRNSLDKIVNRYEDGKWTIKYNTSPLGVWKQNKWKKKGKGDITNKDLWKQIDQEIVNGYLNGSHFVIRHTKGHQKNRGYIEGGVLLNSVFDE